jgi:hypothetical protein
MSGVGDKLPVAWMVDGFDSDDDPHQLGIMLADVLDQLGCSKCFALGAPVHGRNRTVAGQQSRGGPPGERSGQYRHGERVF